MTIAAPPRFPLLLATSVVRGSAQGESHGGVYVVDMNNETATLRFDWNSGEIDFSGRGGDRGLRGIAFYSSKIFIAASDEIFIFDQQFNIKDSIRSPYLKHCHEICICNDMLYATSTGFDSILVYDLANQAFTTSYFIDVEGNSLCLRMYDPTGNCGPAPTNKFHINSIACEETGLSFSGRKAPYLFRLKDAKVAILANIPKGTHNAQRHDGGGLYNDTERDQVCFEKNGIFHTLSVPQYDREDIIYAERYETGLARPGFARGLCPLSPTIVAGGASPGTVSLYDLEEGRLVKSVNLSMDVRNAIHGLAVWPFAEAHALEKTVASE